jgi:hypothetical protein
MPLDFPVILDFSTLVTVDGRDALGAALYIGGRLMDVVKLNPKAESQYIPFWGGQPIHCLLVAPSTSDSEPAILIRLFTESTNLCLHKMSFVEAERTVKHEGNFPYIVKVTACDYSGNTQELGLCYAPDGVVSYIPAVFAPEISGFVTEDPTTR